MQSSGVYLVFGAEGSGKTTLAEMLAADTGLPHVSSGRLVRAEEHQATLIGKNFRERKEVYVGDDLIIPFILSALEKPEYQRGFIIEGFPRNIDQLNALKEFLSKKSLSFNKAVYVILPEEIAIERLVKRGRADDKPDKIKERLASYHAHADQVLEALRKDNKLVEIDNTDSVDQVYSRLKGLLDG